MGANDENRRKTLLLILVVILFSVITVSLALGKYPVPVRDVACFFMHRFFGLFDFEPSRLQLLNNLLLEIRLPRCWPA